MTPTEAPPSKFQVLCTEVEEWEPLPTVTTKPTDNEAEPDLDPIEDPAPLDGLILAGLVSP
jgi:hypothetical protein